jgi:hypothetical protein
MGKFLLSGPIAEGCGCLIALVGAAVAIAIASWALQGFPGL